MTTRRDFVRTGLVTGSAALTGLSAGGAFSRLLAEVPASQGGAGAERTAPLRILVLGGTGFIGPHLVKHAVAHGHKVTTFTRGRRDADLPDSVERLTGDRNGQLDSLKGKNLGRRHRRLGHES